MTNTYARFIRVNGVLIDSVNIHGNNEGKLRVVVIGDQYWKYRVECKIS